MGAVSLSKPQLVSPAVRAQREFQDRLAAMRLAAKPLPLPGSVEAELQKRFDVAEAGAASAWPRSGTLAAARFAAVQDAGPGELQDSWGDLLAPRPWNWFFTGTFRRDVSRDYLDDAWARFASWVRRCQGWRPEWVRVVEPQQSGRLHVHALMAKCGSVRRLSARDYWRGEFGFATCVEYNPALGAGFYLAKCYVAKGVKRGGLDVSFSRRFKTLPLVGGSQPAKLVNAGADLCNPGAGQDAT